MKHRDQILQLRKEGKTYREISIVTGASIGTISYHCGKGQKEKYRKRAILCDSKKHPYKRKVERFISKNIQKSIVKKYISKNMLLLKAKIDKFHYNRKTGVYETMSFTLTDVINKFGETPKCYLTGEEIDIYKPRTYHFDHIIPTSKGGDNSLDNLGICTRIANMAKSDLTLEEFIALCKTILENNNYNVTKIEQGIRNL